jgi:hypothetical protein
MGPLRYRGRRAATIENAHLRVTVLQEGGHIAEIFDKATGVNPLWTPPWPSIEPSDYPKLLREPFSERPSKKAPGVIYGGGSDARLLAGIMGHNLCLDIFGPPNDEEEKAGLTAHGEGAVAPYEFTGSGDHLTARARFPIAGLEFERQLLLGERVVRIRETVKNVTTADRAIGWTQHVTLGPPFLEPGVTQFRAAATLSKVFESTFGDDDYLVPGAEFEWPMAPALNGGVVDLRVFTGAKRSSGYTAHLMNGAATAFFVAFSPRVELALAYVWKAADFPWMGIWEENHSRMTPPWSGRTMARGMEFGVSPMPETRDAMVQRGTLFGVPTFRPIAAGASIAVEYCALVQPAAVIPDSIVWPR